jgi:predicted permease
VRALDVAVDQSVLWVGAGLAVAAAVLLAFVPRLPSLHAPAGLAPASGGIRITPSTHRRLRIFATSQIAFSFVLLAAAGTLVAALLALYATHTGYNNLRQVLALDLPSANGVGVSAEEMTLYQEMMRRIDEVPGVEGVSLGTFVPWRDAGQLYPHMTFAAEGYTPANGEEQPHARIRIVTPHFFDVLGVPIVAGRDFTTDDRRGNELVVIVSQSIAQRLFPNGDAVNRKLWWTAPIFGKPQPHRIVGVVADVDDEKVKPGDSPPGGLMAIYHPVRQMGAAGRLLVRTTGNPYALVSPITRIIRELSANQPVERPATLEDIRTEVLAPERVNAFVVSGFAGIALVIAVVGVAGVLAFGVSARTREFGIRLAVGSSPGDLLRGVLSEGALIVAIGIAAGAAGGYAFAGAASRYVENLRLPDVVPIVSAIAVLAAAAICASLMPAVRASRVDVLDALRSE